MDVRRALAATSVVAGLLGAAVPAHAGTTYTLDGRKTRTVQYQGVLSESSIKIESATREQPLAASRADCSATSCDLRAVNLTVAKGATAGRIKISVDFSRELEAALIVYDAKGAVVASDDVLSPSAGTQQNCCDDVTYRLQIARERLPKGRYTIAIVDRVGIGSFAATVDWFAHPPDRRR